MRYLALIYSDEAAEADVPPEAMQEVFAEYGKFEAEIAPTGKKLGGEALQPTTTATCIRIRDGKTSITDGPFAETKEALGGFYLLDCEDLDEATAWAAKIPGAKYGTIEVRPILDLTGGA